MPSHTFTRVGDWQESIKTNIASAAAARGEASTAEELHATDYLMYAYLQTGEDRAAQRLLSALPDIGRRFNPNALGGGAPPAAGYFALAAVPARYALERGAWREAMRLEVRQSPLPFADAMTHFARALGASRAGDITIPKSAIAELRRIREQLALAKEAYWAEQVEIQRRGASAWLAFAEARRDEAVSEMRATADLEDATEKNAITPGPIAPARELLGEMLLELKRPVEALREFERTLMKEPNRFRALAGAAKAATAAGEREVARKYYSQLLAISARADRPGRAELVDARRSVAR
jgi:tetratricopeptide (TPR) repeat protein